MKMYFGKIAILLVLTACISINAASIKRKALKTKIKKTSHPKIVSPPCGCQNPLADIINCGCRGSPIEPILGALGDFEIGIPGRRGPVIETPLGAITPLPIAKPGCRGPVITPALPAIDNAFSGYNNPVIDIPNYRYADPVELNSLGCLFQSLEIPNIGILSPPIITPCVEYYSPVDMPCGCPGPQCGCRAPAVKLAAMPIDIPYSYGAMGSVIELPSYVPAPIIQLDGCLGSIPACGCQGPCSCPRNPVASCGCKGPCSCPEYQILSCGCQGACSCPGIPGSPCGCKGPCGCTGIPVTCGCQGPCGCSGIPVPCGCQGPCGCSASPVLCGCQGSCGCSAIPVPCGCSGPCSCLGIQSPVGLLPSIEVPSLGCGCGLPGCECVKYLRQVTLQPPFL